MLCRYNAVLYPVTHFVCEMLPEQMRESTRTELFFDDLEKLPSMEVARICEWLTEKVDGFSSKTRAEPKDAEEEVCECYTLHESHPMLATQDCLQSLVHHLTLQVVGCSAFCVFCHPGRPVYSF